MNTPLLSVNVTTYNHSQFIRQCLDGIMMQKTTFPFEVLIHDDASTDGTADIIREYETLYPDIIKPIYQTENRFSRGLSISNLQYSRVKGKYVALCEGDDYWIDPLKLQKQVDFLENNPDYTICGGRYWVMEDGKPDEMTERIWMIKGMKKYPKGRTITLNGFFDNYLLWYLTTCFRSDIIQNLRKFFIEKDDIIFAVSLEMGKGFIFPDYFGVYRLHQGGIWAGIDYRKRKQQNQRMLKLMHPHFYNKSKSFRKWYYRDIIGLQFFNITESEHLFKDYWEMVKFTFSGSLDTFPYRIKYFTRDSFKYLFRFIRKKIV